MPLQNPLLLIILILFSTLIYGFLIACFIAKKADELVALALPTAFALLAISTFVPLVLKIDFYPTSQMLAAGILIGFIVSQSVKSNAIETILSQSKSLVKYFKNNLALIWGYLLILVFLTSHQILIPFYGLGSLPGDWFGHYRITHEFLSDSINEFPMRLPLYQLLQVFFLSATANFGGDFYLFQITQLIVGFSIFPVVHLLFNRLFGEKYSTAILLASALLPYVLVQAVYPWPKILASSYSLLALYFYLNLRKNYTSRKDLFLCGLFGGLSIFSHWLGVPYFVCILFDFVKMPAQEINAIVRAKLKLTFIALAVLLPIYLWGFSEFGFGPTLLANWSIVEKQNYSIVQNIATRLLNLLTTSFLPLTIFIGLFRELPKLGFTELGWIDTIARAFSWHFGSVLGNLTLSLTVFVVLRFLQDLKTSGVTTLRAIGGWIKRGFAYIIMIEPALAIYIPGGILLMTLSHSNPHSYGVSLSGLLPSVLLLFGFILSRGLKSRHLLFWLFIESMLVVWAWQAALIYLDLNYAIQSQSSDPALMVLNEVIQYKRDFKLIFWGDATGLHRVAVIVSAILSQIGIFAIMMRERRSLRFS